MGKKLYVGNLSYDVDSSALEQLFGAHGTVESASQDGIKLALKGERDGQTWTMPADPSAITPAQPGKYQLPETGEIVENPDFICTWMVQRPKPS